MFVASPGKPIEFMVDQKDKGAGDSRRLCSLRDFYGLDIRQVRRGDIRVKRISVWCLVGEWFGKIYIDYTADTEEHMDLIAEARYALLHAERPENILPAGVHYLSKESIEILERVAAKGREMAAKLLKRKV